MKPNQNSLISASKTALYAFGLTALFVSLANANEYTHGHTALEIWDKQGQANAAEWVKIWLKILMASVFLGLFFVWTRVEARWVVGGILLGLIVSRVVLPALPIVKLSGLVALLHLIFWTPGLILLLKNKPFLRGLSPYAVWSGWMLCAILFSFIFDIRDAAIYLHHIATR